MPLKYAICCQFRKLPPSPKLKQFGLWWFRRCPVFGNRVLWMRLISQGNSGQMAKVTWGPTKGQLEMPSVLMAGKCGADFTCEWGLGELPRSFLRAPVILSWVPPWIVFLCGKCQCLSFKSQREKKTRICKNKCHAAHLHTREERGESGTANEGSSCGWKTSQALAESYSRLPVRNGSMASKAARMNGELGEPRWGYPGMLVSKEPCLRQSSGNPSVTFWLPLVKPQNTGKTSL